MAAGMALARLLGKDCSHGSTPQPRAMTPPFTALHGFVKYMRPDDQDPISQQAMMYAFGEFFADEKANERGKAEVMSMRASGSQIADGPLATESPYKYRRFAGGAWLPRGRYFTLASADADDGFALECELRSYVDHERAGRIQIKDGLAARHAPNALKYWEGALPSNSIWLKFWDNVTPNSFVTWLIESGRLQERCSFELALTYRVEEVSIERVIDLRTPEAQNWLYAHMRAGLPGVGYYYAPDHLVPGLVVRGDRPTASDLADSLHYPDGDESLVWYPARQEWNGKAWDGSEDFFGLLPFLLTPTRGGSPITEAVGRFIQSVGAAGLVFPSARSDVLCQFDDHGKLELSLGWNFVDYRDAPAINGSSWIIIAPDSWWGLPMRTDVQRGYDGRSWAIVGTAQSHSEEFQSCQAAAMLGR